MCVSLCGIQGMVYIRIEKSGKELIANSYIFAKGRLEGGRRYYELFLYSPLLFHSL